MRSRFIARFALLLALLLITVQVFAEVSAQLRDQITQQAASLALPSTWVYEELGSTGFLDDAKTREIVQRSPAAYALAWSALQAEEKQAGAAVELLSLVAQGIAARHSDAVRYEPAMSGYFQRFPSGQPVPPPQPRHFEFERSRAANADVAKSLPAPARAIVGPLAKYAYAYPGGMQGMIVDVLRLQPTEAMSIELSSPNVDDALFTAVERAKVPPPTEVHLREVLAALLLHGGEAIKYEEVVKRVGLDNSATADVRSVKPLVEPRESSGRQDSATRRHDEEAVAALAGRLLASLKQNPLDASPQEASASQFGPLPIRPPSEFLRTPSFTDRMRQLHSDRLEPVAPGLSFRFMRSIGGGRGGGGIVIGNSVSAVVEATPIGLSYRPVEGGAAVVLVVALSDGRVVSSAAVRPDVLVAAHRIGFGDPVRGVERLRPDGKVGAVLISLMTRASSPTSVTEFLVHPAIADLQVGRDLVLADSAEFLFSGELSQRVNGNVGKSDRTQPGEITLTQWRSSLQSGDFGGWYRYVERPVKITTSLQAVIVTAANGPDPSTLFELLQPAESRDSRSRTSGSADSLLISLGLLPRSNPERAVVIRGATDALLEFRALNDLLRVSAIMRWAHGAGARWLGGLPQTPRLEAVRSVVKGAHSWEFDPRSAVQIELDRIHEIARVLPVGIPAGKIPDAKRLNQAFADDAKENLVAVELESRGFSTEVAAQATRRLRDSRPDARSNVEQILWEVVRKEMEASEFEELKMYYDLGLKAEVLERLRDEAYRRQPWMRSIAAAWHGARDVP